MAAAPEAEKAANIGPDGETIVDMHFYELLGVRGDATETDIKKAYRKAAIKWHPDKNPGNPDAEAKFREISEAYNTLQDSNLRAAYNKNGMKQPGEQGPENVDPMQMFGSMFGGEAFHDWVGEISLFKDFAKMADISTTEEEKEQLRQEMGDASVATNTPSGDGQQAKADEAQAKQTAAAAEENDKSDAKAAAGGDGAGAALAGENAPASSAATGKEGPKNDATVASADGSAPASAKPHDHKSDKEKDKLTAEQKAQMEKMSDERLKEREERIQTLARKLVDRCRAFEQARNPGDKDDPETLAFQKRIQEEAEDMKAQSFGIELLQLIGAVYMSKASTYLRLHKGTFSNFAGIPGFFSRLRDKKESLKEGWSFLTTTLDVQSAMEEMQKKQESVGDEESAEAKELEGDMVGKLLLVSWKGTKFELNGILRSVVDVALSKEMARDGMNNQRTLQNRAKAILTIGTTFAKVQPDEGDDERRELEKLMAEAATKRRAKGKSSKPEVASKKEDSSA